MKNILVLILAIVLTGFAYADGGKYKINDETVNQMFTNAPETNGFDFTVSPLTGNALPEQITGEKNPWVAWALTFTAGVGICGIHRLYLGTKTGVFIAYLCTAGGCGIVQTIDWVVLLIGAINKDISKYIDNSKLFMF